MIPSLQDVLSIKTIDTGEGQRKALLLCASVDAFIRRKFKRDPEAQVYTKRVSGSGTGILKLPVWPILSVTSLSADGSAWTCMADADTEAGQHYAIGDNGWYLEARPPYYWPEGVRNIQVTCRAGYEAYDLQDLRIAGGMIVHLLKNEELRIGDGQVMIGDMNVQAIIRNSKDYQFIEDTFHHFTWRP